MAISRDVIEKFLPKEPVIVEAGAHRGHDTITFANTWPSATIYTFEPVPELYQQLVTHTKSYPQIRCYQLALAAHSGKAPFYVSKGATDAVSSLLVPLEHGTKNSRTTFEVREVTTITLDDWAAKHSIQHVDFLWLDMQGAEYAMLQASPYIIDTVSAIHTEVNLTQRYNHHPLYPEYRAWLEKHGFNLVIEDLYKKTWGNALFVKKERI